MPWVLAVLAPLEHRAGWWAAAMKDSPTRWLRWRQISRMLSLFAIGGANAAVPEMHRLVVDVKHWMTDQQFADMFAIAQVTPGPERA